jgi:hypothetical protein
MALQDLAARLVGDPEGVLPRFVELAMQMTLAMQPALACSSQTAERSAGCTSAARSRRSKERRHRETTGPVVLLGPRLATSFHRLGRCVIDRWFNEEVCDING